MRHFTKSLLPLAAFGFLTFAPAPLLAAPACGPLKIVTSLELKRLPTGRPAIAATIGDKPQTLLVDTGAAFSTLNAATVRDLKLTPTKGNAAAGRTRVVGINGAYSDAQVRLPSIVIGNLKQEGAYFFVAPPQNGRPQFTGILGPDFLKNFDADFDFANRKLNLISPDHCDGQVVYWQAPTVAVVPMQLDRVGHVQLRIMLDGKRVDAMLDTGATTTVLNQDVARRTFGVNFSDPDVEKVGELRGNFTAATYRRRFSSLAFEGVTITNPTITMIPNMVNLTAESRDIGSLVRDSSPYANAVPDLLLGMDTLSKVHLYIAYKESKVYVTVASPAPAP